jgi:glutamyl-tRNA synthetase
MDELVSLFTLDSVGKSPAVFNPEKLLWLNQHYIKEYPDTRLAEAMKPFWKKRGVDASNQDFIRHVVADLKTRSKTLVEMADSGCFYFQDKMTYDPEAAGKFLSAHAKDHLTAIAVRLPSIEDYTKTGLENFLRNFAEEQGIKLKVIAQPLRVALTGKTVSPGIDEVMITLGKERVISRIHQAIRYISNQ